MNNDNKHDRPFIRGLYKESTDLINIVKGVIDFFDPIGLLELDCPKDEYIIEARIIAKKISENRRYDSLSKMIQKVFEKQFDIILEISLCKKMRNEIIARIDYSDFIERFEKTDNLKEKIKLIDGIITMKVHDGFVVTTDDLVTYINGKFYYQIDDQDLVESYYDLLTNGNTVYIQYKHRHLTFFLMKPFSYIKEVKKDEFLIDKVKYMKDVEIIFDNKKILYIND